MSLSRCGAQLSLENRIGLQEGAEELRREQVAFAGESTAGLRLLAARQAGRASGEAE